uniref:Uncharacterized protein n=1 Tax=Brassica oleracea var. oleracea TaxID=109376 RepID=A0A0D3AVX6_BRAOL
MQMRFSNVTSISNKDFASRFQLMGMHRHMEQRVDFMDWGPDFLTYAEPETVVLLLKFSNSGAVLNVTIEKIQGGNDLRAMSVGLGVSTDSIGESGGWMVRKGMHTRQLLQQRTDTDDQTETGETWTPLLNMYKAQMQFCEDSKLMKVFLEVVRSLYELL